MQDARNGRNSLDTGLQSFKIDKPLHLTAVVVALLAVSLYSRLIELRPWSWLARGGLNAGVAFGLIALHLVVFCAIGYLLLIWMKRRTSSSTLTLGGLVLILFIRYPMLQHGPLVCFIGPSHSSWPLNPSKWYLIGYSIGLYSYIGLTIAMALWINYLVYRLARRHGIVAALVVSLGIWGFYFGPLLHGASLLQTILLRLAIFSLAMLAWRPSSVALKTFVGLIAASFLVGIITGGLGAPVFTAFGLRRVTIVPFWVFSTGALGAAVAAVLARWRPVGDNTRIVDSCEPS